MFLVWLGFSLLRLPSQPPSVLNHPASIQCYNDTVWQQDERCTLNCRQHTQPAASAQALVTDERKLCVKKDASANREESTHKRQGVSVESSKATPGPCREMLLATNSSQDKPAGPLLLSLARKRL